MSDPQLVLVEERGRVRLITLNRPDKRNAFTNRMYHELATALEGAAGDEGCACVVLTGAGDFFTAGQDLTEMGAMASTDEPIGFQRLFEALQLLDKPLIGAVQGSGVGLGFTLLLHLDLLYVADDARFRLPFVPMGVVPEAAASHLLVERFGWSVACEMLFTGRWVPAAELERRGVANAALPKAEVLPTALQLADTLAAQPASGLIATKQLMKQQRSAATRDALTLEAEAFARILSSPEQLAIIMSYFGQARGRG